MNTALIATSRTLKGLLDRELSTDSNLAGFFNMEEAGTMEVSLTTPQQMHEENTEGISVWLYRVVRDDQRLNSPPVRVNEKLIRRTPLPLRLHYLITPIVTTTSTVSGPELEQIILGKVLEVFYDHPNQQGSVLKGDYSGTDVKLYVRLEPLSLEEITRIWDALDCGYRLSVSYEVTTVEIESDIQPRTVSLVEEVVSENGVVVGVE
jgi:hypothetical protein